MKRGEADKQKELAGVARPPLRVPSLTVVLDEPQAVPPHFVE